MNLYTVDIKIYIYLVRMFLLHPSVSFHIDDFIFPAHLYFHPLDGALLFSPLLMCEAAHCASVAVCM